ncbi:MAG: S9 family peptidase, partial [Bacteroidales bacterium]
MHKNLLLGALLCGSLSMYAEKKPLDHSVYDQWKSIGETSLSKDGSYVLYQIKPQEGDASLVIDHLSDNNRILIERGHTGIFTQDQEYAICLIKPYFSEIREAKIKKKKADDMPKDSLAIVSLKTGKTEKIPAVSSYKTGVSKTPLLAFSTEIMLAATDTTQQAKKKKPKKEKALIIRNLKTQQNDTLLKVSQFILSHDGTAIAAIAKGDSLTKNEVYTYHLEKPGFKLAASGQPLYTKLSFSKKNNQLAFLASADTSILTTKRCDLYHVKKGGDKAERIISSTTPGMAAEWGISEYTTPYFSKDEKRIFFGTAPVRQLKDTTLVDFETARLDLWHYAEALIPPMQLKLKERELKRSYLAVTNLAEKDSFLQLGNEKLKSIQLADEGNALYAFGEDSSPYDISIQWLGSATPADIYRINTVTGEKNNVAKKIAGSVQISPAGKYIYWFDIMKGQYYACDVISGQTRCLTEGLEVKLFDEENDTPGEPREYGIAGWMANDENILVYDYYDIWQLDPKGIKKPVNITAGTGRKNNTVLRMVELDKEKRFIGPKDRLLLQALDKQSKQRGFYTLQLGKNMLQKRIIDGYSFNQVRKAKEKDIYVYQKANFNTSPDIYVTSDEWKSEKKLSDINPQMSEYLWGTPELYHWTTFSGKPAEGIIYKPENFDPTKKYPVLIYFYERVSDNFYNYVAPSPSRSIINISFYTSRGYIVFTPDIRYTDGEPGESAYDYIVSGAKELAKNSWVDSAKMGIQ